MENTKNRISVLLAFHADEEWEGVSSHRYCWFHSKATNYAGEDLSSSKIILFLCYPKLINYLLLFKISVCSLWEWISGEIMMIKQTLVWKEESLNQLVNGAPFNFSLVLVIQVAAFRATLEEISESSLLVHVVDIRWNTVFLWWLMRN